MIPRIIHYCWFGGKPKPEIALKCIESWEKYCPDYVIKEWNETNFDINSCHYVKEAYEAKKWAFITDYVRLYALVKEGGIYMDTDVEVLEPLDKYLDLEAFSGFEDDTHIPTGIMASQAGFKLFDELLKDYNNRHFYLPDGSYDLTTNVETITNTCAKYGLKKNNQQQSICGFVIFPKDVFCPKNHNTGKIEITARTSTIHHFSGTWISKEGKAAARVKMFFGDKSKLLKLTGNVIAFPLTYIDRIKYQGIKAATLYYFCKILKK